MSLQGVTNINPYSLSESSSTCTRRNGATALTQFPQQGSSPACQSSSVPGSWGSWEQSQMDSHRLQSLRNWPSGKVVGARGELLLLLLLPAAGTLCGSKARVWGRQAVQHSGKNTPVHLGIWELSGQNSSEEKDTSVAAGSKLSVSQQCTLAAKKTRSREVILLLLNWEDQACVQVWAPWAAVQCHESPHVTNSTILHFFLKGIFWSLMSYPKTGYGPRRVSHGRPDRVVTLTALGMQQWQLQMQPVVSRSSEKSLAACGCFQNLLMKECGTWGQIDGQCAMLKGTCIN